MNVSSADERLNLMAKVFTPVIDFFKDERLTSNFATPSLLFTFLSKYGVE